MSLSHYEKRSLIRFLLIYLCSIYMFIFILAGMFYTIEKKNIFEQHSLKLGALASSLSHQIITSHMMHDDALKHCMSDNPIKACFDNIEDYEVAFFDANKKPLYASFEDSVDFSRKFYEANKDFFYVDDSVQGHLGIAYIVLKKPQSSRLIQALQKEIALYLLLSLSFATLLGFILAKLFLQPIRTEIETLNTFIKDSTHELNTPITAILMSIQTLKEVDEKKKKRIELSAKRIATLYGNLSYMLLHDKQNEAKSDVNVKKLVEERLDYFADLIMSKKINVTLQLEEKVLKIHEESLIKLIDNLLSNAIKYNNVNGMIQVLLTHEKLSISDNGIGIEASKINDITKRYKRANSDKGGFGIGLDIVNTICKQYGFRLEITSKEHVGSTFNIYFQ